MKNNTKLDNTVWMKLSAAPFAQALGIVAGFGLWIEFSQRADPSWDLEGNMSDEFLTLCRLRSSGGLVEGFGVSQGDNTEQAFRAAVGSLSRAQGFRGPAVSVAACDPTEDNCEE